MYVVAGVTGHTGRAAAETKNNAKNPRREQRFMPDLLKMDGSETIPKGTRFYW